MSEFNPLLSSGIGKVAVSSLIDTGYQIGDAVLDENQQQVAADRRSILIPGVAADAEFTIEVVAFRKVDSDIAPGGIIRSAPFVAPSSPYQPSPVVSLGKDALIGGKPSQALVDALKDTNGDLVQVASAVSGARAEAAQIRTDLVPTIAAAKQEGTTARAEAAQVRTDLVPTITAAKQEGTTARQEAAQVRTDLVPTIAAAKQEGTTARSEAAQVGTDLATEVSRAKGAEGTLTTKVTQAQSTADGANTAITTEQTTRANADTALANRATTLESSVNTGPNNLTSLRSGISDEATTRANADSAAAGRLSTLETSYNDSTTGNVALKNRIATEETARSDAVSAVAGRTTALETTVNDTTKGNNALVSRITTEETTRGNADTALATRATNLEATVNTGANRNALLRANLTTEETARTNADTALANRATSLEARSMGGGNLLTNTDFITTDGWQTVEATPGATFAINAAGDAWHPVSENALSMLQYGQAGVSGYTGWSSSRFAVTGGTYLQAYCYMASHRCQTEIIVYWTDGNGNISASTSGASTYVNEATSNNGGNNLQGFRQQGWTALQVPGSAVSAIIELRKYNTLSGFNDSYAWFVRPYVGYSRAGATEWAPYSPGSAKAGLIATTSRITTEETTRSNADTALANRATALESSVNNGTTGLAATYAKVSTEETTRANADTALSNRATALESTVNDAAKGNAALQSRIATEETTRADANTALATRATNLESTVNTGANRNSLLRSDITSEATTRANADTALATRSTTLESKVGSNGAINVNPAFGSYTSATGTPDGWTTDNQTNGGATRVAGETGGYALQLASSANVSCYAAQTLGPIAAATWWVIEADVKLTVGTLAGAGVLFRIGSQDIQVAFATEKDSTDTVVGAGTVGQTYRYRKLVQVTQSASTATFYYMNHWSALGSIAAANTLIWYRNAVRPASAAEIAAQRADTNANSALSKITTEETTRANADTALSNRATALESTVNNGTTGVAATYSKISTEETTRSNADTALANRATALESTVNSGTDGNTALKSRISTEETTRANADTALASRATSLESLNNSGPANSINANPMFSAWPNNQPYPTGWSNWVMSGSVTRQNSESNAPGTYSLQYVAPANAETGLQAPNLYTSAGWYVLEAEVYLGSGTYYGSGVTLGGAISLDFARDPDSNGITSATGPARRKFSKLILAPAYDNIALHPMANWTGFGQRDAKTIYFSRCAIRPATDGEIKAQKADTALNTPGTGVIARITTEETTRANADTALANRATSLEARTTGSGNLLVNTDWANGVTNGWTFGTSGGGTYDTLGINGAGDSWHPYNENALTIHQVGRVGSGDPIAFWTSQRFAVTTGQWLQFYAFVASHRSNGYEANINFYRTDNTLVTTVWTGRNANISSGGMDIGAWQQLGNQSFQVPSGSISAEMQIRKFDTASGQSDSWLWFTRPYVGFARQGQTEYNAYSPGSASTVIANAFSKVTDEATARTNADTALSNRATALESSVNNGATGLAATYSKISTEETTRANADTALGNRATALEARSAQTPVSFIARAYGNGTNSSPFGNTSGIANASGTMIATNGRSYGVYVFDGNNTLIAANSYDVYGDGAARQNMANFLNGITNGQAVIVTTADEPRNGRLENGLVSAMERCGAGDVFYTAARADRWVSHNAYILVGRAGIGRGNGQEFYKGDSDAAPNSWLEAPFQLLRGVPVRGSGEAQAISSARISDEQTVRANADTALSNRISTTESKLSLGTDSELYARIRTEETTRATADNAIAQRTSYLESTASLGAGVLNANPNFTAWPDGQELPSWWYWWQRNGAVSVTRPASEAYPGWCVRINVPADQENGFAQMDGNGPDILPGWYVMEADVRLESGSWSGSGITIQGVYSLNFATETDTSGSGANSTYIGRRRFTKLVKVTGGMRNWHPMTNWSGFGGARAAKQMVWYRCAIRPASDAEILAQKVNGDVGTLTSRIGTEETTRANAVSALANRTSTVEAQVTTDGNNLVRNPTFNAPGWVNPMGGIPAYWGGWAQDNGAYIGTSDRRSNYGAAAPLQIDRNGNNNGISQNLGTQAAGWYVLEADITAEDGNWTGCGVHINFNNGYSRNFHFGSEPDTNGGVVSGNIGSVNRKFSTMFYNAAVGNNVSFYLMAGWEGFATGQGFLRTIWHRACVRAATDAEIKAQKVQDSNLIARVATTESTLAQAGNLAAYWNISAQTPGASAFITAQAKTSNGVAVSNVSIGGTAINLVNTDGTGIKKGLAVENGTTTVYGNLRAGAAITLGSGSGWPVALASKDFNVSNGEYVAFGTTLDSLPNLSFAGNGLVSLNSGETYRLYAENLTRDGFTARLEISVPASPSNYDLTTGQYSGSGLRIIDKYPRPDSTSNSYNVTVTGTITATAYNNGDTYCIWTEAYTYTGKKGYELAAGDLLMVMEDDGSYAPAPIQEIGFNREDTVLLRSASGIELTVSKSTPVTLRDGSSIKATQVQGLELPVMDDDGFRWEEIVAVEEAGVRPVARIYVGDKTYAAGNQLGRSIFTHNIPVNKN